MSSHLLLQGLESLLDDAAGIVDVSLVRGQRGSETDDVVVGGLGEKAVLGKLQAHIPGSNSPTTDLNGLDDNGIEQTLAAHSLQTEGTSVCCTHTEYMRCIYTYIHTILYMVYT